MADSRTRKPRQLFPGLKIEQHLPAANPFAEWLSGELVRDARTPLTYQLAASAYALLLVAVIGGTGFLVWAGLISGNLAGQLGILPASLGLFAMARICLTRLAIIRYDCQRQRLLARRTRVAVETGQPARQRKARLAALDYHLTRLEASAPKTTNPEGQLRAVISYLTTINNRRKQGS